MELLLIRHALPERIDASGDGAPVDPPLTDEGRRQAAALAAWLRHVGDVVDAVYTSPLRRAVETAAPLCETCGVESVVDEGVSEFDRGFDFYIPMEELKAENHPHWQVMSEGRWDEIPGDLHAFGRTVTEAIDAIAARHPGERVAVVCHGGVLNAYVGALLGIDRPLWFEPGYTSVSRVLVSRDGVRSLASLNETAHLKAPLPTEM